MMCIVVDINALSPVFSEANKEHSDFRPVKDWIHAGKGVLVFGGSKFKDELSGMVQYLRLIRQLKDAGKAVAIQDDLVDEEEERIIQLTEGTGCDDQHLIALLGTARCPLFCSKDSRSYNHVKNKSLYPKGMARVKIYSSVKNKRLLVKMDRAILRNQA